VHASVCRTAVPRRTARSAHLPADDDKHALHRPQLGVGRFSWQMRCCARSRGFGRPSLAHVRAPRALWGTLRIPPHSSTDACTHSPTHSLTHSLTPSRTRTRTSSHARTHARTHTYTYSRTLSRTCTTRARAQTHMRECLPSTAFCVCVCVCLCVCACACVFVCTPQGRLCATVEPVAPETRHGISPAARPLAQHATPKSTVRTVCNAEIDLWNIFCKRGA
jgi:hypothetical protein